MAVCDQPPLDLLVKGKPFIENFEWDAGRSARFRVLRRSDGKEVVTCQAELGFAFHHVNAFERDGEIVCDVVGYPDASIIEDYFLDRLRSEEPTSGTGHLRRYRLPLNCEWRNRERRNRKPRNFSPDGGLLRESFRKGHLPPSE